MSCTMCAEHENGKRDARPGGRVGFRRWVWIGAAFLAAQCATAQTLPEIRSACEIAFPPFCTVDDSGRADGFSVELLRASLAAMGRGVSFETGEWVRVKGMLERGEVQALPLVGRTPEREAAFDFTFPYMTIYGAIVVRQDTTDIHSIADLAGRRVTVMKADNAEEFLRREHGGLDLHTVPTFERALEDLSSGQCDAVVMQRLVAARMIADLKLDNLKILTRPIETFSQAFCFAVHKGDAQTLALLNEGLSRVIADGTYRRLHSKWFAALELPAGRRLILGGDRAFPPYEYLNERGAPEGFAVDLMRAISREMGMDIEIRLGRWSDMVRALESGSIDAMEGMLYSPARDLQFEFSSAYASQQYIVVMRSDAPKRPKGVKDLIGLRLAVQAGDWIITELEKLGLSSRIVTAPSQEDVLREVLEGRADGALVLRRSAAEAIRKNKWTTLTMGRTVFFEADYCVAVPKGHQAIIAQFDEGLRRLKASGEYRKIYEKWLGVYDYGKVGWRVILRWFAWVLSPILLVLALALLWVHLLRRQVAVRTHALHESESKYRGLVENIIEVLYTLDLEGRFTFVSPSWTALLGCPEQEALGADFRGFIHPEDLPRCEEVFRSVIRTGSPVAGMEYRVRRADGTWRLHLGAVVPVRNESGKIIGLEGVSEDITLRREAETNYQTLFEKMLNGFALHEIILDGTGKPVDYRFLAVNPAFERMTGLRARDIVGKTVLEALPGTEPHWIETYGKVALSGEPVFFENESGSLGKTFEVTAFRSGPNRFACIFSETTVRTRALHRIEHLNRVLRAIRDVNQLISHERDREQMIHAACRLLANCRGYTSTLIVLSESAEQRKSWAAAGLAADSEKVRAALERGECPACCVSMKPGETLKIASEPGAECEGCPLSGICARACHLCIRLAHESKGYGFLLVIAEKSLVFDEEERSLLLEVAGDLGYALHNLETEADRRQAEQQRESLREQLNQAQKMEAVGRLAGGVAHDFNNLLMGILGYVEMARDLLPPEHPALEYLVEVTRNGERSADLTRQLLTFARRQTVVPRVLDLNDTISGMLKLVRLLLGEDIEVVWIPGLERARVKMDPTQVDQILANLCVNARDAIQGAGLVTIETATAEVDAAYCEQNAEATPGSFVRLSVRDNGCGMDPETLDHIFEPFFSTKEHGKGTGLGLATVYGIVKQNGGFIHVMSAPGQGTTFQIYLPRTFESPTTVAVGAKAPPPVGGTETILLVEDEDSIRAILERHLRSLGYRVQSAADPRRALEWAASQTEPVPLLISDVIMPGMSGREMSDRLRKQWPALRILFMSGYTADVIAKQGILEEGFVFLQKPVSLAMLAQKVREALDAVRSGNSNRKTDRETP